MSLRLLAVHAHPDDESSKGAATYAYYVNRGVSVTVVSCTGGERGDIQNDTLEKHAMANRDMAGLRYREMAAAAAHIGCDHRWLGYLDSGLPDEGESVPANSFAVVPLESSAAPLVKIIRELRPQVVHTYDQSGGYPHPDHIRTHEITVYAIAAAADPTRYPDAGAPWSVSKLYYDRIFNPDRMAAVYNRLVETEPDSERTAHMAEMQEWMKDRPVVSPATSQVSAADYFETRDNALRAHASQVAPHSRFFFLPNDLQRDVWPYEDYELAWSLVPITLPESDLFAGIDDHEAGVVVGPPQPQDQSRSTAHNQSLKQDQSLEQPQSLEQDQA